MNDFKSDLKLIQLNDDDPSFIRNRKKNTLRFITFDFVL